MAPLDRPRRGARALGLVQPLLRPRRRSRRRRQLQRGPDGRGVHDPDHRSHHGPQRRALVQLFPADRARTRPVSIMRRSSISASFNGEPFGPFIPLVSNAGTGRRRAAGCLRRLAARGGRPRELRPEPHYQPERQPSPDPIPVRHRGFRGQRIRRLVRGRRPGAHLPAGERGRRGVPGQFQSRRQRHRGSATSMPTASTTRRSSTRERRPDRSTSCSAAARGQGAWAGGFPDQFADVTLLPETGKSFNGFRIKPAGNVDGDFARQQRQRPARSGRAWLR